MANWLLATSGNWGDGARWSGGLVPNAPGASAVFTQLGTAGFFGVDLGGVTRKVGTLTMSSSSTAAYALANGTIEMDATGFGGTATINLSHSGGGSAVSGTSSTTTLNLLSNTVATIGAGATFNVQGAISGGGSLTKAGAGDFTLVLGNTLRSGATIINEGRVIVGANNALGFGDLTLGGGTLSLGGTTQEIGSLAGTSGTITGGTGSILSVDQSVNGTYSGAFSGAMGLIKNGGGNLTLSNNGGFTGATTINSGILYLGNANALRDSSGVNVGVGGTLGLNVGAGTNYSITNLTGAGSIGITSGGTATLTLTNGNGLFSGVLTNLTGVLSLVKNGSGITYLTGANTYTGGTTVNGGILLMGGSATTGTVGSGSVTINGGTFALFRSDNIIFDNVITGAGTFDKNLASTATISGNNSGFTGTINVNTGTLFASSASAFGTGAAVNVGSGAVMDLSNGTFTFRSLTGAGTITGHGGTFTNLNVDGSANSTFSGVIQKGSAYRMDFSKLGTGTLTLSGVNTFDGLIHLSGGTLALSGSGSISNALAIVANAGATFDISGISAGSSSIIDLTGRGGSIVFGGKTLNLTGQTSGENALTLIGSAGADGITWNLEAGRFNTSGTSFDLSSLAFTNWTDGTDRITVNGSSFAETIIGSSRADILNGGGGNDILSGGGGDDTLNGGTAGGGGWNTLSGDAGSDTASYEGIAGKVYADLSLTQAVGYIDNGSGFVFNDALIGIENLTGGANNDQLTGDGNANVLNGGGGNDVLNGGGGNDTLLGGGHGPGGFDVLYGEGGSDTASFAGVTGVVYADLLANNQTGVGVSYINLGFGFVHDALLFTFENLTGGSGNDILLGDNNANVLTGGDGGDFIMGQDGADTLIGGLGNDSLYGGNGADRFVMDANLDIATGGTGADVFFWNSMIQGADVVSDFSHAEGDKIHLDAAIFGVPVGWTLSAGLNFISGAGATSTNATATIMFDTTTNILWYDIDGTGVSGRQAITFLSNGGGGITASDIVFE